MPRQPNDDEELPYVRNASDRKQLRAAKKISKDQAAQQEKDLQVVLSLPEGRRVLWRILRECKVFESIWHPSALIHFQAGQQDLGHMLMAWINDNSPETLAEMFHEYQTPKETEE
jgi:hypothetical protein